MSPVDAHRCKAGKICDNGVERSLKDKPENNCHPCGGGCVAVIIIFFVILPLCCIGCSVAACCFACQQNNRRPQARVQQQPVAYAAAQPAGGAVQMQQYGKQPYQTGPPQAPYVALCGHQILQHVRTDSSRQPPRPTDGVAAAPSPSTDTRLPRRDGRAARVFLYNPLSYNPLSSRVQGAVVQGAVVQGAVVQGEMQREY